MARAIVLAAGSGERMRGEVEKQFLPLRGVPLVVHTLRIFEQADSIRDTLLIVPKGRIGWVEEEIVRKYSVEKVSRVVEGGAERQDSVYEGLGLIEGGTVVVHDGVRPFVSPDLIDLLVTEAEKWEAVISAVRIKDTVKLAEEGIVRSTLNREGMWLAQTPQVFQCELIKRAYHRAYEEGYYSTDDSALVERLGHEVRIVEGSYRNIKITTGEDILLAETLLEGAGSG